MNKNLPADRYAGDGLQRHRICGGKKGICCFVFPPMQIRWMEVVLSVWMVRRQQKQSLIEQMRAQRRNILSDRSDFIRHFTATDKHFTAIKLI